ncbi:MAG: beta-glucuronidase [Candidatus Neomarinimicrobiota bacterium]
MLYPQQNRYRSVLDLSGFWELKVDPTDRGQDDGWAKGFQGETYVGVPGSWNEQLAEVGLMNYMGSVWYQTHFCLPREWERKRLIVRFGSADYHAEVWVNGISAGGHSGGYLPFELDITDMVDHNGKNVLVARVNNILTHDTIPQGVTDQDYAAFRKQQDQTYPPTSFDFFPYAGLHRPVKVLALPRRHLDTLRIDTGVEDTAGRVAFEASFTGALDTARIQVSLWEGDRRVAERAGSASGQTFTGEFVIPDCHFWSPESPHLYTLRVELKEKDALIDEYESEVGVRRIEVTDTGLLLNGKPIFLRGFGKHEDFPVLGKGISYPLVVKDFLLMKWVGANSFRTSHYPYAEGVMQLADRLGFLVIDEVPAVSLNFRYVTDKTLESHKRALTELITRDRNHPAVIAWSVGNEPGLWGEPEAVSDQAKTYWEEVFRHARKLDSSRPITLPTCAQTKDKDPAFLYSDFVSVNRYWGWYEMPVEIDTAAERLKSELETLHEKYRKPILLSEFGADTLEGQHATYPQMFTEEYQTLLIKKYFEVIDSLPFIVGEHIWNFADFRTSQHHRRIILNKKGIFNRQREPKTAAFAIRERWLSESALTEKSSL